MTNNKLREVLEIITYFLLVLSTITIYQFNLNVMCYFISICLFLVSMYSISCLPEEEEEIE